MSACYNDYLSKLQPFREHLDQLILSLGYDPPDLTVILCGHPYNIISLSAAIITQSGHFVLVLVIMTLQCSLN